MCGLALAAGCSKTAHTGIPAASGSTSVRPTASSTGDAVAYARCMRQHGVNVPDPVAGSDDWGPEPANGTNAPGWSTAWEACKQLLPAGMVRGDGGDRPSAQDLEKLRAYAVCMREHDIGMTDPDETGNLQIVGRLERATRAQLENDPGYKAATEACKDKLPKGPSWGDGSK